MRYEVRNPDPAWPEIVASVVFLALCATDGLSSLPMGAFLAKNWWPILRIVLPIWALARLIDWKTGGPERRAVMRVAYRRFHEAMRRQG